MMLKLLPKNFTAFVLACLLAGCSWLPYRSADKAPDADQTVQSTDAPYVDYWQTRDPSEYRHRAIAAKSRSVASRDVVVARRSARPKGARAPAEGRVAAIISLRGQQPSRLVEPATPLADDALSAPTANPVKSGKGRRGVALARRKGKTNLGPISKDLWGRIRGRMALAQWDHPRIDDQINWLKRNPGYLNLFAQRARPYLHYIIEHIDRNGLPRDLAMVPMVESAYQPVVFSPKEAAGLWQFIPSTGQEYGLTLAEGYDGRLDIHTSTDAALRYLRYLNRLFNGDWLLALAAYNAGPRAVQVAIKNRVEPPPPAPMVIPPETNPFLVSALGFPAAAPTLVIAPKAAPPQPQSLFWSLKLPKETQDYVPRIVALARVVANPGAYGLKLPPIPNQQYLYRVDLSPEIKLFDTVTAAGIPNEDFVRFNPGFKPGVEPPTRPYKLLLPLEQAQNLAANAPGARLQGPSKHTVQEGETLDTIAKLHGVPSRKLAQWNGLSARRALKTGQQLIVYPSSS